MSQSPKLAPSLYIPHGGGPLPLLGEPSHAAIVAFLSGYLRGIPRPQAIVVISAHWEAPVVTITGAAQPSLIYDYYGFPPASYQIRYPAPGAPALAQRILSLLQQHQIPAQIDTERGFDHGLFVPLKLMQPDASIPCLQVSLLASLDARAHVAVGNALYELRKENILILGSGFSFHNLSLMRTGISTDAVARNEAFHDWLLDTCTSTRFTQQEREERLMGWQTAPHARFCHPREEHLLPLMVCAGAATQPARCVFDDAAIGMRSCALEW